MRKQIRTTAEGKNVFLHLLFKIRSNRANLVKVIKGQKLSEKLSHDDRGHWNHFFKYHQDAGYFETQREGRNTIYSLTERGVERALNMVQFGTYWS